MSHNDALKLDLATRNLFTNVMLKEWCESFVLAHGCFDIIVDVGAHCGLYSVIARAFNPKADIVALEPSKEALDVLTTNLNGLNVAAHMVALGNGLSGSMAKHNSSVRDKFVELEGGDVPSMLLSDAVAKFCPDFKGKRMCIKMNCEGAEALVFNHEPSLALLDAADMVLMECHGRELIRTFEKLIRRRFSTTHMATRTTTKSHRLGNFRLVSKRLWPKFSQI